MTNTTLKVHFAGALVSLQDKGRPGHMRYGVPASGPMDRIAFSAANVAAGNDAGSTAIEISLGGLKVECETGEVTVAIAGGDFVVEHAGRTYPAWTVLTLYPGEQLSIRAGQSGSWAYLAFAGELKATAWLGSTATHSTSGFGGGAIQSGQHLLIEQSSVHQDREGSIAKPNLLTNNSENTQLDTNPMRVVMGPQDKWFSSDAKSAFQNGRYALTDRYDRMGVRLQGPCLPLLAALSIPSEPILRGSVQVSGDGIPTVLLADHQTTGGYPKIATLISPDTDILVQLRSRAFIEFIAISPTDALKITRCHLIELNEYLDKISLPKGTLQQRLMNENLISGIADFSHH